MSFRSSLCFVVIVSTFSLGSLAESQKCHFSTWDWNTQSKRAEKNRKVVKLRSQLSINERDSHSLCTICEEDQVWIKIDSILPFQICKHFAEPVRKALIHSLNLGFPIYEVSGYRVGKTKGPINSEGFRTAFSNHSFGTAIDINSKFNGLYDNCIVFKKACKLIRGGPWSLNNPASIQNNSSIYKEFQKIGWKWGGELQGKQKDFMHFSISGD